MRATIIAVSIIFINGCETVSPEKVQQAKAKAGVDITESFKQPNDDFRLVWNKLYVFVPPKSEFESDAEYMKRIPTSPTNTFYFDVDFSDKNKSKYSCKYNPESKRFEILISFRNDYLNSNAFLLFFENTKVSSYKIGRAHV